MRRAWAIATLLFTVASTAFADTVRLKSGEMKTGKVLVDSDDQVLLKSDEDGAVVEIPRRTISILERDPGGQKKGGVGFVSTVPPSKRIAWPARSFGEPLVKPKSGDATASGSYLKDFDQAAAFGKLEEMFEAWMSKHPEFRKWFEDFADKSMKKNDELDKLVQSTK